MSRAMMPPGFSADGYPPDYDGPTRMPVQFMSVARLIEVAAHLAAEHPDVVVGLCVLEELLERPDGWPTRAELDQLAQSMRDETEQVRQEKERES